MTALLDSGQMAQVIELASRVPSPHNIQPARWRFTSEGRVELHEDTTRWLGVGDPTGRDNALALGAAWEGMALALSTHRVELDKPKLEKLAWPPEVAAGLRRVAGADLRPGGRPDPLADFILQRRSFRGSFASANEAQRAALRELQAAYPLCVLDSESQLKTVAAWHDAAAAEGMRNPAFVRELHGWMRFSRSNPSWVRDGLSTDCMALSALEAVAARYALKPAVVRLLCALSLEGLLVAEASKVHSAAAVVVLHGPADASWFDAGRGLYRFWLDVTRAGLCGVPMSALADSETHAALLRHAFPPPRGQRLVAVMRVGRCPHANIALSARLPLNELLLP